MNKNVNELAREALEWFITDTRDNGEKFTKTKDGRPDWLDYYSVLYLAAALINSLRELCGAQEDEGEQEA